MDDATYRRARIRAAHLGTSVSAMVRDFLNREEGQEAAREAQRVASLEALFAEMEGGKRKRKGLVKPFSREEIHATRSH